MIESLSKQKQSIKATLAEKTKVIYGDERFNDIKNEFKEIKHEVNKNGENYLQVTDSSGTKRNVFKVALTSIVSFISVKLLKKEKKEYSYIKDLHNNLKVKTAIAIILSLLFIFIFLITLKVFSTEKENYGEENIVQPVQQQTTQEESNTANTSQQEINRISDAAIEEEIEARNSFNTISYYFNVNRTIKTKEKVHLFDSANWNNGTEIVDSGKEFNVNLLTSPGGYMMYQIADGEYVGKFITANNDLVEVTANNDGVNTTLINKPIAISIVSNTNSYYDIDLDKIKASVYKNVKLNILGFGVNNKNRLVYYIADGSFIPIDPTKIIETTRTVTTTSNANSNTNANSSTNTNSRTSSSSNSTNQTTTTTRR